MTEEVTAPETPEDNSPAPDTPETKATEGYWPSDWRDKIAGDDEKTKAQLERYADPTKLWDKARSLEQKMSSGEYQPTVRPEREEDLQKWREERGIPEKAEGYLEHLGIEDGVLVGEMDSNILGGVVEKAHAADISPKELKVLTDAFFEQRQIEYDNQAEADATERDALEDDLRAEWGDEYRQNDRLVGKLLDKYGVRELLGQARTADGGLLGNRPEVMKLMAQMARNDPELLNAELVGGDVQEGTNVEAEIAKIRKVMREDRPAYNRDKDMQARFAKLLQIQSQRAER